MTTALIISLTIAVAASGYLAARYMSLGARRSIDDLEGSIDRIYHLSDPRLSLMIREFFGDRFLQFRSTISKNDASIELWLPAGGWSENFQPWIAKKCIELNFPRREFSDAEGRDYTVINFGSSSKKAAKFASDLLIEVLGLKRGAKVSVRIDIHN
jgi:hypothetical protein